MKKILVYPSVLISFKCPYCSVTGKIKGKQPPEKDFIFKCPGCDNQVFVKLNNRSAYRKDVSLDVFYSETEINETGAGDVHNGVITDISIKGLKIITSYKEDTEQEEEPEEPEEPESELEKLGNTLFCHFTLPGKPKPLQIRGKIVRCIPLGDKEGFDLGVVFLELNEFQTQEIGFFLM